MVRTNQGGSVLSFVVVGIILVGLVIGGVYGVRQLLSQPQPSEQTPVATQPEKTQQPQESAPKPEEKTEAPVETKPETAPQPQSTPAPIGTPAPAVNELPRTGPAENVAMLIGLVFLTIASVSYVRSRRLQLPL